MFVCDDNAGYVPCQFVSVTTSHDKIFLCYNVNDRGPLLGDMGPTEKLHSSLCATSSYSRVCRMFRKGRSQLLIRRLNAPFYSDY